MASGPTTDQPTIGLLGATGYTGELTTAELIRRGIPHVLGGRSQAKLDALPGDAERRVIDTSSASSLRSFFAGVDVVISCIGPFVDLGDPVVDAAVAAGIPYVDSTGEMPFMQKVYQRHGAAAVPVVPACGFDVIPGDMSADLACCALEDDGEHVSEVLLSYSMQGTSPSRGTARTAVGIALDGGWSPRKVSHRGPHGPRTMSSAPFAESATIRLHRPAADAAVGHEVPKAVEMLLPLAGPGMRLVRPLGRIAAPLIHMGIDRLPDGPAPAKRDSHTFTIVAEARASNGHLRQVVLEGKDPYGLTARTLVESALRVASPGSPTGALSPSMAFDSADFLGTVGLTWTLV